MPNKMKKECKLYRNIYILFLYGYCLSQERMIQYLQIRIKWREIIMKTVKEYIKLMRCKHYIKNFLIFLPIIFSFQFQNITALITVILGFISFCFVSSIVYILNDACDIEKDRKHPTKCHRPLAAGTISKRAAYITIGVLTILVIGIQICMKANLWGVGILGLYLLLNIAYSKSLKHKPLIDIVILVSGFFLRVLYGAVIIGVEISSWLYLTIISFSFYLSLGKRRNEIEKNGTQSRKVLQYYTKEFLDKNMYMCLALTIVFYALWCVSPMSMEKFNSQYLIWTVPVVMIICMKYSLTIEGDSHGDPVEVLLSDKILMALVGLYVIIMGIFIVI